MQKDILDFLSEFAVFLQDHKFAVSESALAHLLRLVESAGVDITEEDEMLAALSVCLAKTCLIVLCAKINQLVMQSPIIFNNVVHYISVITVTLHLDDFVYFNYLFTPVYALVCT